MHEKILSKIVLNGSHQEEQVKVEEEEEVKETRVNIRDVY
jgi:hypothetical protein